MLNVRLSSLRPALNQTSYALGLAAFLLASPAYSHNEFELDAWVGYGIHAPLDVSQASGEVGEISFDGALVLGASAGYRLEKEGFIFLSYSRTEPMAYLTREDASRSSASRGVTIDQILFGGTVESQHGRLVPYLSLGLGVSRLAAVGADGLAWTMLAQLSPGVKLEVFDFLHLRLEGRLPVSFVNGETRVFCLESAGCRGEFTSDPLLGAQLMAGLGLEF